MKKYIKTATLSLIICLFTSCDSFLDVNENPNAPTDEYMTLAYRLPTALYYTGYQENLQLNQLGSFWAGYWGPNTDGSNSYKKEQLYNGMNIMAKRDGIPIWENGFVYLNYYELLKKQADDEGAKHYGGIARIMQAWHFMRLVDVYGDVPFDQALKSEQYPRPQYEDGQLVYKKSIDMITEAIGLLNQTTEATEAKPSKDDIVFGGDAIKWIRLGNTLKLRALLRQSETNNDAYINSEIGKMMEEGSGFLSVSAMIQPGFTSDNMNPFWSTYYRNASNKVTTTYTYMRPTQYIIDRYEALNDPRLDKLYVQNANGDYKGILFGYSGSDAEFNKNNTSAFRGPSENGGAPGAILKSAGQPMMLMGAFESYFIQTEAAFRGWISTDAKTLYEKGIESSCLYMEVAANDITDYIALADVAYKGNLDQIILQKWLALNSISGIEAWSDYRRLGMPDIPNSLSASLTTERPCRLLYPETEVQTNIAEVNKRNITDITKARVWWDAD